MNKICKNCDGVYIFYLGVNSKVPSLFVDDGQLTLSGQSVNGKMDGYLSVDYLGFGKHKLNSGSSLLTSRLASCQVQAVSCSELRRNFQFF